MEDGNEADVSDTSSPPVSPSLREWEDDPEPMPPIAEGVPVSSSEGELRVRVLLQQLDTEKKRAEEAVAGRDAARAREALYKTRLQHLLGDASVSPPASSDDDQEIAAKRRRVSDAHNRAAYAEMAKAVGVEPLLKGQSVLAFGKQVVDHVTEKLASREQYKEKVVVLRQRRDECDDVLKIPRGSSHAKRKECCKEIVVESYTFGD